MALFGRERDKEQDKERDKERDKDRAPDHEEAPDPVVDQMVAASGGDTGVLAKMIAQHRMERDGRLWKLLHRRLGNRKVAELQQEIEQQAEETKAEAGVPKADYRTFCAAFATSFGSVLSEFPGGMTTALVPQYFTAAQVVALTDFMQTNVVPPHLFHQASGPKLTAQHRILLAGVILAHGTLPPEMQGKTNLGRDPLRDDNGKETEDGTGKHDNRLHASMCGHWAQQVYLYAGAGIAAQNKQTNQTVDSGGTLHLGNATADKSPFGQQGDKKGLPLQGKQKAAAEAQDQAEAAGRAEAAAAGKEYELPKKHQDFRRMGEMGEAAFTALHPGDWIYIYNANSSASGQHSEIFIGWADDAVHTDKASGVKYKVANVMSQLQTEDGGKVHKQKLGAAYAPGIATVTAITRVTAESGPLLDVRSLVAPDAVAKNAQIIEDKHLDVAHLRQDLVRTANKELAELIGKKLDPAQQELFKKAIDEASHDDSAESLALLIACVQRMDLSSGTVFNGRVANGIIDDVVLHKKASGKKKKAK